MTRRRLQHLPDSVLGHKRQVAGQQQHCLRTSRQGAIDASFRGDVLAFFARLEQDFSAPRPGHLRDLVSAGHDKHMVAGGRRAHRQPRVAARESPSRLHSEGGSQALLGRVEVLDQDDDPGPHAHCLRILGRICAP